MARPTTNADAAARLRREARDLREQADRLQALADQFDARPDDAPPPLTGNAAAVADVIRRRPGRTGDELAAAVGLAGVTFRKHLAPRLRRHGFWADPRGGGYHPPRNNSTSL